MADSSDSSADHLARSAPGSATSSAALRRHVDAALDPAYEAAFARLDVVLVSPEARCGCLGCLLEVDRRRAAVLAALPRR